MYGRCVLQHLVKSGRNAELILILHHFRVVQAPRRLKIDGWGIASIICLTLLVALQIFGTAYDMWYEEKQKPKFSVSVSKFGVFVYLPELFVEDGGEIMLLQFV